jgi:SAM-dependent methyltransferase
MSNQAHHWSATADRYEAEFIDPYRVIGPHPLLDALRELGGERTVADLGCGVGPLLPFLSQHFRRVLAIDFAEGMLARALAQCKDLNNVEFQQRALTDLDGLGAIDVAVAVNSLILPRLADLERALAGVRTILRPGGAFLGIVPAMDAVHYHTMLLVDRARAAGMPEEKARQNAAMHGEHELYDFAFSGFRYKGLEQHFWQEAEVPYRLQRAGFRMVRHARLVLSWEQHACGAELAQYPPPWDWFFHAEA